jgi:hypothetical protein
MLPTTLLATSCQCQDTKFLRSSPQRASGTDRLVVWSSIVSILMYQPPANSSAPQLALICAGRRLTIRDAVMQGDAVLLTGVAEGRLVGKVVEILFDGHQKVASTRVRRDGSSLAPEDPAPATASASSSETAAQRPPLRSEPCSRTVDPPVSWSGRTPVSGEVVRLLM